MRYSKLSALFLSGFVSLSAFSQSVIITEPWIRSAVQGQKATGAFMKIASKDGVKLIGVSSPVAGISEIHEMKMEKDVMKMAAIPSLSVPAGGAVELKPGGYHLMLMDLKSPLEAQSKVPLTLIFESANGVKSKMDVQALVKVMGASNEHKH
jgi:copper(I)-binding protein